jgi:hypothetical protein
MKTAPDLMDEKTVVLLTEPAEGRENNFHN